MSSELKKFYDEYEQELLSEFSFKKHKLRMKLSASLVKDGKILDVGCQDGNLRFFLNNCDYYGIDITSKHFQKDFNFILGEATRLPFKNENFDTVTALEVIEHLFNPWKFVEEIHRILGPQGVFVLSTPNAVCLLNRFKIVFGLNPSYFGLDAGHLHCFTFKVLRKLLEPHFVVVKKEAVYTSLVFRGITHKLPFCYSVERFLAKIYPNLSDVILVKAVKK